jgi:hypothetical protein
MFTDLPSSLGVQLCYRRDNVPLVSAGLDYTFGSTYDSSLVDLETNTALLPDAYVYASRSPDVTVWIGMCEQAIASNWKLSFGGFYSTGTAREDFISPLAPDAGRAGLHACVSTPISDMLSLEWAVGYMETALVSGELKPMNFEGTYKSRTWTFHIGISGK